MFQVVTSKVYYGNNNRSVVYSYLIFRAVCFLPQTADVLQIVKFSVCGFYR